MQVQNIPLPKGISGLSDFPRLREHLVNLLLTESGPIRAPGIEPFANGRGVCRGAITWSVDGVRYQVSGNRLERVERNGTVTDEGIVEGDGEVLFSAGQVEILIIIESGKAYRYHKDNGLSEITDPDYYPAVDADFIDGRHVMIPSDGEPAFYTNIDDAGNIDGLAFFDAEELPDRNRCVVNVRNTLYIGGDNAFEMFVTNANPDVVFTRRDGGRVDVGYIGGKVRHLGTFAFLGRERDQGAKFYLMGAGSAQAFSNSAIDELLNTEYTDQELRQCRADSFEHKGYKTLAFHLPRHTLCFSEGAWFYMDSTVDGKPSPWRARAITYTYGQYLCGDAISPAIGRLSDATTEYGNDIEFEIQTFARSARESYFTVAAVILDCLVAQSAQDESISLSISRDGFAWSQPFARSLGTLGNYHRLVKWEPPGGLGMFENYMGLRLRSTADAKFALEALSFK